MLNSLGVGFPCTSFAQPSPPPPFLKALRFGESCSSIKNTTLQATQSLSTAVDEIDRALAECNRALSNLTSRNMSHLPSCKVLRERYEGLLQRRRDLVGSSQGVAVM